MTTLADTLGKFVQRSLYSHGQLALLADVPKNTLSNWLSGRVSKPHQWHGLLKVAAALHLSEAETDALLAAADHPPLARLREDADEETAVLITQWPAAQAPFQAVPDLPTFVGREAALTQLRDLLQRERQVAIVSLHGMGGVGKTALAARLAYEERHQFPDGVLWLRLDSSSVMANLLLLAGSYGEDVSQYDTVESRSAAVRGLLANKRALLILDNADSSDQVEPLLPPTTGTCRVLVTTRHDLAVLDGWPQLAIRPFSPDNSEAMQLFNRFLGETAVDQHQTQLAEISTLVGQLPLALAIIAAQLARDLAQIDVLLQTLRREDAKLNAIRRENRGVRLTFDLSFAQLTAPLQQFFVALGAFGGDSFSAEASAFVAQTDDETARAYLDTLHGLSLVQDGGNGRFRLHLLLRDYAREKLAEWADADGVYGRMCHFYIQLINPENQLGDSLRAISPAIITNELSNLYAAMQLAQERQMHNLLMQAVRAFFLPLYEHGLWQLVATYIDQLLGIGEQQREYDMLAELFTLRGKLLWWRGEDGSEMAHYAVQFAHRAENPQLISDALRELGAWLNRNNRQSEAVTILQDALALALEIGDKTKAVSALNNLGHALLNQNKLDEAQQYLKQGYDLAQEIGYYRAFVILAGNLGALYAEKLGEWETAVTYFEQGAKIGRAHNCFTALMGLLGEWGYQALFFEQLEAARSCFAESLEIAEANNHSVSIAVRLADLGEVARRTGETQEAASLFIRALQIGESEQLTTWLPIIQLRYALLLSADGKQTVAAHYFEQGWQQRHQLHHAYDREVALIAKEASALQHYLVE